jgi:hypothetical protein
MKTAIQQAFENYKKDGVSFTDWFIDNYEILLEKEKEQIRLAFREGHEYWGELTSDMYYDQTYNQ